MDFDLHCCSLRMEGKAGKVSRASRPLTPGRRNRRWTIIVSLASGSPVRANNFANLPEYSTLKTEHSHFHKAAATVVRRADSGQKVTEDVALGGKSEFATASAAVVRSIMALKSKVVTVGARELPQAMIDLPPN